MPGLLIIDDDDGIRRTLELHLKDSFSEVTTADSLTHGKSAWTSQSPDIVILDLMLPDGTGLQLLQQMYEANSTAVVIMITGQHEMEYAVEAMKHGAFNYINKPLDIHELNSALDSAQQQISARSRSYLLPIGGDYRPHRIVGTSRTILDIHKQIGLAAKSRVNVLIEGESGTGKELVARAIHEHSIANMPFVAVNCSAIVPTLAESELFGHERGAFTGAHAKKIGKLELAGKGTLFLDEIADMPIDLQAKLLRVIQERSFERVGGRESIRFEARVVSATNKSLDALVADELFREDLYFRIKVMGIKIPPLRERIEDIPELVEYLLEKINRDLHRKVTRISGDVLREFQTYRWPGNVRELENVLTQAVVRTAGDVLSRVSINEGRNSASVEADDLRSLAEVEKEHIIHVLKQIDGNLGRACEILGITRPTLRKKMDDYGLRES